MVGNVQDHESAKFPDTIRNWPTQLWQLRHRSEISECGRNQRSDEVHTGKLSVDWMRAELI